jgi:hypothetical protein
MDEPTAPSASRQLPHPRWCVALALFALITVAADAATARFTNTRTNGSNTMSTATLNAPSTLTLTSGAPVGLSWTASSSTWSTGARVYRSTTAGGARTLVGTVTPRTTTTYTETPGLGAYYYEVRAYFQNWLSNASNQVLRSAPTFTFGGSTGFTTAGNCDTSSQVDRDMVQAYSPTGTAETWSRAGGVGTVNFCSDVMRAGEVLAAGTTTVDAYFVNTAGSTCQITATLYRNGTTALGSGSFTVPNQSALALRTWSFATTGFTAAAGDRLELDLVWQSVKACDSTDLHWNGASTPSSVTVPTITGA